MDRTSYRILLGTFRTFLILTIIGTVFTLIFIGKPYRIGALVTGVFSITFLIFICTLIKRYNPDKNADSKTVPNTKASYDTKLVSQKKIDKVNEILKTLK